jgi:hypothetical protein
MRWDFALDKIGVADRLIRSPIASIIHSDLKTMHLADDGGCAGRAQWIGLAFELF